MSLRNSKDEIIKEIRDLRTLINEIYNEYWIDISYATRIEEALRQLNKIQDKVFNI